MILVLMCIAVCYGGANNAKKFSPCEERAAVKCLDKCRAHCNNGVGNGPDCRPGKARFSNDDNGGVPGAPGSRGGGAAGTEYVVSSTDPTAIVNPSLVFLGSTTEFFHKTVCQDKCEEEEELTCRYSCCEAAAAKTCDRTCKAKCNNGVGNGPDCRPGRARFDNDDRGGVPGAPGARGGGAMGTEYVTNVAGTFKKTVCNDDCEEAEVRKCRGDATRGEIAESQKCFTTCKAHCNNGVGNGPDCRPGRARYSNDDYGGTPGNPGSRGGGELGTAYVTANKGDQQVVNSDLIFQGSVAGTFHRTRCQDICEDAAIPRHGCPGITDVEVPTTAPLPPPATTSRAVPPTSQNPPASSSSQVTSRNEPPATSQNVPASSQNAPPATSRASSQGATSGAASSTNRPATSGSASSTNRPATSSNAASTSSFAGEGTGIPRETSSSSGGAVSTGLVVGVTIGVAAVAGVAALAIGLIANGSPAVAAAPSHGVAMGHANTSPLYQPLMSEGTNAMHV